MDGHAGIAYSRAGAVSPWQVRDIDGQARQARIQPQVSLDDVQAIAAAAIEGFGLAWMPSWLLSRYEKTGELVVVMNSCGMLPQDIHDHHQFTGLLVTRQQPAGQPRQPKPFDSRRGYRLHIVQAHLRLDVRLPHLAVDIPYL